MSTEEFEKKLRSHDPAAHLAGRESHEERALFERAINGTPANVVSISRWTNRRKAVSAAAAALLVVGFGGPIISGTASAGPDRLVFGEAQSNQASDKSLTGLESRNTAIGDYYTAMGDYYVGAWGFNKYELNLDAVVNLPSNALAYKFVNVANIQAQIELIANTFGINDLVRTEDEEGFPYYSDSSNGNFYAWAGEGSGSFSYYNAAADPWKDCYKVDSDPESESSPVECDPKVDNLLSPSEARIAAIKLFESLGLETENLRIDVNEYDYSTEVSAYVQVNGIDTPISYYVSYVSNGDIYVVSGSLTKLVEIGSYDLIDVAEAVERANTLTNRTVNQMNKDISDDVNTVEPRVSDSDVSLEEDTTESSEPVEDSDTSTGNSGVVTDDKKSGEFVYEPVTVNVSKVDLGYQMFWMADQSVLWLPVVNFYGVTEHYDEVMLYGTIAAIVNSQIDMDSLYSYL